MDRLDFPPLLLTRPEYVRLWDGYVLLLAFKACLGQIALYYLAFHIEGNY